MAQENTIVKLPVSGLEAEIRGYVRRKDESRVENAMFSDDARISVGNQDGTGREMKMRLDMAGISDTKVWTMLVRLGDNPIPTMDDVQELHRDDFKALLDVVDPMIESSFDAQVKVKK